MLYTLSRTLAAIPHLAQFLGSQARFGLPLKLERDIGMVGWGRKRSYRWAKRFADLRCIPCLSLEDGFLRSVGLGSKEPPLSLVIDDIGIYYDATKPSRLEYLIANTHLDAAQLQRVRDITVAWRDGRLSKYNHARPFQPEQDFLPARFVLVVDQTFGDASIRYGMADASSFRRMLEAALDEHPDTPIVLKLHPEVFAGHKKGHFDALTQGPAGRVHLLGRDVHAPYLLERAEAVYSVTSQMGFEGLLWGKPVRTFGMPFYAGWGLTQDELKASDRRRGVSLETLVHAALIGYPRYVDPETGQRCEVERVIALLGVESATQTPTSG